MKNTIGLNEKTLKRLPVLNILMLLILLFPYVDLPGTGKISGYQFLAAMHRYWEGEAAGIITGIYVLLLLGMAVGAAGLLVAPDRKMVRGMFAIYLVHAVAAVLQLFTAKMFLDRSSLTIDGGFFVKYFGMAYWLYLILAFVGLAQCMRTLKIDTGYIVLVLMVIVWLFPIAWLIMISFREESGSYTAYFFPKKFTINNYVKLLTDTSRFQFVQWFLNTLVVAIFSCIVSTFLVLSTSYTLSRIRFAARKPLMNIMLVLGMFPGFMSMIAVYYILKGMGLSQTLLALVMVYSGSAGMGYYIAKGFFDTIPKALDEAAIIDGATRFQIFTRITIPLSKPIIIYTILMSFIGPWADFIYAKVILGDDVKNYTVAIGLYTMLSRDNIETWYTRFAAGSVLVSIPICILFICLQKYYVEGLAGSVKG